MKKFYLLFIALLALIASCTGERGRSSSRGAVWGAQGIRDGMFLKPRAIAVHGDEVYVIDTTGRVQVFTIFGTFARKWSVPESSNGTPTSISFDKAGNVIIPDTHYSRILKYTPKGELLNKWGAYGTGNDEFIYPTDIVQAPDGRFFISEYGMGAERVRCFDANMRFVKSWGEHGDAPGQFDRAMSLALGADGILYVVDTANHRVQCFDLEGKFLRAFGKPGSAPGELKYPEGIALAPDGTILLCEYGNHRVSRFSKDGRFMGTYGRPGRAQGQFGGPRGIAVSKNGMVYVADTDNHRIQIFPMEAIR